MVRKSSLIRFAGLGHQDDVKTTLLSETVRCFDCLLSKGARGGGGELSDILMPDEKTCKA